MADFSCSICFDTAKEPVVTKCGHLYCWSCLRLWLQQTSECPMCKGHINETTAGDVIPLYGKGKAETRTDSAGSSPPPRPAPSAPAPDGAPQDRPRANREAPQPRPNHFLHVGGGGGMLFFMSSPSLVPWPVMLLLVVCALLYKFAPLREWATRMWDTIKARVMGRNAGEGAAQDGQNNHNEGNPAAAVGRDITQIAMVVLAISITLFLLQDA